MKKCKLCFSDTYEIVDAKREKLYHRCHECDFVFLDEQFYLKADEEKKHYDNHHNTLESLGYVKIFEDLIENFILQNKTKIKTALDFGCGEGGVLPILLERHNISCDRYDLFYFPKKVYEDREYDLIVSTEVFEHLSNPLDIFTQLLSHIKANGYLLLSTYFHPSCDEKFLKWFYIQDITHIGFFTIKTFESLATKFNLKILKSNDKNTILFQKK